MRGNFIFDYYRLFGVKIKVARIFNTYGAGMSLNDARGISNFIQALKDRPIRIYGTGQQTRSFCYVDDFIDGIFSLMLKDDFIGPVNLSNNQEYTVLNLEHKVIELTNSQSQIVYKSLPEDDPKKRCPDLTLAKRFLHYCPQISIEDGLKHTISHFENLLHVEICKNENPTCHL